STVSARGLLMMLFTSLKHSVLVTSVRRGNEGARGVGAYIQDARYATDVTFQQTNVPADDYAEKKLYFSGKHSLDEHKVEVSMVPNGFAIDCTKFYKGSVSDKTIFDENIDPLLVKLAKRTGETTLEDSEPGMEQSAVLADKGYQGIRLNHRAVLPLRSR
ncbi:hypothetical protein DYB30_013045, partial [Aphanomyces astaci]